MKRIIITAVLAAFLGGSAFGAGDYGTPGEFLNWGAGARSLGMGKAFTGLADDSAAIYYNPAGLAIQNPLQISLMHVFLFEDTIFDFAAVTYPLQGVGTFGLAYVRLSSFGFDARDSSWSLLNESFDIAQQAVIISYAREVFSWMSAGINLKMIHQTVFDKSGMGFGADLGLLFTPAEYVSFGLNIMNAVPAGIKLDQEQEAMPIIIKTGVALKLWGEKVIPVFDMEQELSGKDLKFRAGLEVWPIQQVAIRAGIDETELTFGLGARWKPYQADYSISIQELGLTHRVSFGLAFGGFDINLSAEPKIFSPVGIRKNTTITIYALTKFPIDEWELNIMNEDGDPVRTYSGDDNPPAMVIWDGKDDRGLPVSDGEYTLQMKVIDKNKNKIESGTDRVKISSSIPLQPGTIRLEE